MNTVNCPHCQKSVVWSPESLYRPFCSERCQLIDLGAWADNRYSIPMSPSALEADELEIENTEDPKPDE